MSIPQSRFTKRVRVLKRDDEDAENPITASVDDGFEPTDTEGCFRKLPTTHDDSWSGEDE
jgi:hypothetical protein